MQSTPADVLEPLNIQSAATRNKIGRAMKAHGIVALRKKLSARGLTDLPDMSSTHMVMLAQLTPERLVREKMTRKEWARYADHVLGVAKEAQKSLAGYKLRVQQRCKAELAELHAVHRHMPRNSTRKRPKGRGASNARKSH